MLCKTFFYFCRFTDRVSRRSAAATTSGFAVVARDRRPPSDQHQTNCSVRPEGRYERVRCIVFDSLNTKPLNPPGTDSPVQMSPKVPLLYPSENLSFLGYRPFSHLIRSAKPSVFSPFPIQFKRYTHEGFVITVRLVSKIFIFHSVTFAHHLIYKTYDCLNASSPILII